MTTQTASVKDALSDLDRAVTDLTAAQERQPPQPPSLTPDVERQDADVTMCHMLGVWLGWHYRTKGAK